jgi:hypothetical protein
LNQLWDFHLIEGLMKPFRSLSRLAGRIEYIDSVIVNS